MSARSDQDLTTYVEFIDSNATEDSRATVELSQLAKEAGL